MPERYTAIDRPGIPGRFFFIGVVPELQLYGSRHCVDLAVRLSDHGSPHYVVAL